MRLDGWAERVVCVQPAPEELEQLRSKDDDAVAAEKEAVEQVRHPIPNPDSTGQGLLCVRLTCLD